jgi:peptide/nickel transport system ATP-binding protein
MSRGALLEVREVSISYFTRKGEVKAVEKVSFSIDQYQTLGLIGESGSGKSTLVSAIMRFVTPPGRIKGGQILFDGQDILTLPEEKMRQLRGKSIGIVFQAAQNALNPVLTIGKQIAEQIIEHERVAKSVAWKRAEEGLVTVGIGKRRIRSYPHELSGGMKQRVMIAIATACNPRLLIMDEPVTGLDVIVQRQLLKLIADLREKTLLPIILITHDLAVITETCDRVAVMYAGRIVEEASTVSLYQNPLHPYSAGLVMSYPSIQGEKRTLRSIPGSPPNLIEPPTGCRFHPRCSKVMEICSRVEPAPVEVQGHRVACHLWNGRRP